MKRFHYENVELMVEKFHFFKTDLTYEEILATELESEYDRQLFGRWEYNNHINLYFLDLVLNAIKEDDQTFLTELLVI